MGLSKEITLPSGVPLQYFRVAAMTQHVNEATIIEVQGYTSHAKRLEEKAALAANREAGEAVEEINVFIETSFHNIAYDPAMDIPGAYAYLKTLPELEGAEDVLEEGGE